LYFRENISRKLPISIHNNAKRKSIKTVKNTNINNIEIQTRYNLSNLSGTLMLKWNII